jgi:hypothetical protein
VKQCRWHQNHVNAGFPQDSHRFTQICSTQARHPTEFNHGFDTEPHWADQQPNPELASFGRFPDRRSPKEFFHAAGHQVAQKFTNNGFRENCSSQATPAGLSKLNSKGVCDWIAARAQHGNPGRSFCHQAVAQRVVAAAAAPL